MSRHNPDCEICTHSHEEGDRLECRRYPPTIVIGRVNATGARTTTSQFPDAVAGCGEWELQS